MKIPITIPAPLMPLLVLLLLAASSILLVAPTSFAQQEQEEPASVLSKAADLVDLQAGESAPFMMLADVRLSDGKKSVQGVYAMASANSGEFRRVFRLPDFSSIEVVTKGVIYRQRSTEALPLLIWEAEELVGTASQYRLNSDWKLGRVKSERAGSDDLRCVVAHGQLSSSKICVDAATGAPHSIDRGLDVGRVDAVHEHFEFSDYQPFEGKIFPRQLTFRGWGSRTIEVRVRKLFSVKSFPADEFSPPKDATRMPYCEAPQTSGHMLPSTGNTIPIGFTDMRIDMYFQVSPQGGVQYAQVVYSSDPLHNKEVLNWFLGTHFPIRKCAGTPISYEMLTTVASQ